MSICELNICFFTGRGDDVDVTFTSTSASSTTSSSNGLLESNVVSLDVVSSQSAGRRARGGGRSAANGLQFSSVALETQESPTEVTKTVRTFYPETWLWDLVDVRYVGE